LSSNIRIALASSPILARVGASNAEESNEVAASPSLFLKTRKRYEADAYPFTAFFQLATKSGRTYARRKPAWLLP